MYRHILVPVDLAEPISRSRRSIPRLNLRSASRGYVRIVNVLPMTPVMLAEYVPADFDTQQRQSAEEAWR